MQLTRFTDYGLRILIYLAVQPAGRLASIEEVCQAFDLPRNHINKIVHLMGRLGWVLTRRGKGGGICLALPPEAINLGEVILALEGQGPLIDCQQPSCALLPVCRLKGVLAEAMEAFAGALSRHTLDSLVGPCEGQIRQRLLRPDIYVLENLVQSTPDRV